MSRCSICDKTGHNAGNKSFHPDPKNVIEHVPVEEPVEAIEPKTRPSVKHLGIYSTIMTVIQLLTSGELREDAAKDILIALTNCL
jgi:hypothetical protein